MALRPIILATGLTAALACSAMPATAAVQRLVLPDGSGAIITTADATAVDLTAWPMLKAIGQTRIEAYGGCAVVIPPVGLALAVPLKPVAEWQAFVARAPGVHPC